MRARAKQLLEGDKQLPQPINKAEDPRYTRDYWMPDRCARRARERWRENVRAREREREEKLLRARRDVTHRERQSLTVYLRVAAPPRLACLCVQVTLLKQEKVPCISDNDGKLAINPKDPFQILTKPHGHGDVHYLLHSSGTLSGWRKVRVGHTDANMTDHNLSTVGAGCAAL